MEPFLPSNVASGALASTATMVGAAVLSLLLHLALRIVRVVGRQEPPPGSPSRAGRVVAWQPASGIGAFLLGRSAVGERRRRWVRHRVRIEAQELGARELVLFVEARDRFLLRPGAAVELEGGPRALTVRRAESPEGTMVPVRPLLDPPTLEISLPRLVLVAGVLLWGLVLYVGGPPALGPGATVRFLAEMALAVVVPLVLMGLGLGGLFLAARHALPDPDPVPERRFRPAPGPPGRALVTDVAVDREVKDRYFRRVSVAVEPLEPGSPPRVLSQVLSGGQAGQLVAGMEVELESREGGGERLAWLLFPGWAFPGGAFVGRAEAIRQADGAVVFRARAADR
ncbi:MAG TPA: hypothetical protein RMH99_19925 [Sandaracinaceae bacterium LLY-WYZ-13_1]|nr:hypothetical protein [Sandaracinaceae bacterium LLY-WYZ-13_1]